MFTNIHKSTLRCALLTAVLVFLFAAVFVAPAMADESSEPYLTFSSEKEFKLLVSSPGWDGTLKYSTDLTTWTVWRGDEIAAVQAADSKYKIYLNGTDNTKITGGRSQQGQQFVLTGTSIACTGNIETLLNWTQVAAGEHPDMVNYCYSYMFSGCTSLTTAPALPAETLKERCYSYMFSGCTSLKKAPDLPATTLASNCYSYMFSGCTSLETAPTELPAENLKNYCYYAMFSGCTSLKTAPELKATTLAMDCYHDMFSGCDNLKTAPELKVTTLRERCYESMFSGCTSLTTAPALPAEILINSCYSYMFSGCTSLETAPELPATTLANYCYEAMFSGCTRLKTAPALSVTTLAGNCYEAMFSGCTSLETAPELPATTLASSCYTNMFSGCTSLETAPELPATNLASNCYENMFKGCTSLETAPDLPAEILINSCYSYMFSGCTSLKTAPELKATTLANNCYKNMFSGCTNLETAPALSATTLASSCYANMFSGCIGLKTAPALPATTLENNCYKNMFSGCTSLETAPELKATTLASSCYANMFSGCTSIKLSAEQKDEYTEPWSIPLPETTADNWNTNMFSNTGGTFTGAPAVDTTYYQPGYLITFAGDGYTIPDQPNAISKADGATLPFSIVPDTCKAVDTITVTPEGNGAITENSDGSYTLSKVTSDITITVTTKDSHTYGEPTYEWSEDNSICTAERVCSHDSGHTESETVSTTPAVTQPQSCENDELTKYTTAAFENSAFTVQTKENVKTKDKLGHDYGNPTYEWSEDNSTCTAERVCSRDSEHTETETVSTTPAVTQPQSCENDELTTYTTAAFENSAFTVQTKENVKTKDKLGHDYGDLIPKVEATTSKEGFEAHYLCSRCDTYFTADKVPTTKDALVIPKLPKEEPKGSITWIQGDPYKVFTASLTNGGAGYFDDTVYCVVMPAGFAGDVILTTPYHGEEPAGIETLLLVDISINGIMPADGTAVIKFKLLLSDIEPQGLTAADVCLYHNEYGEWVKLDTVYEIIDGVVYYEATVSSFSPFAIAVDAGGASSDVAPTATSEPLPTQTESPLPIIGVLAGLAAVVLVGCGIVIVVVKRKKRGKEQEE